MATSTNERETFVIEYRHRDTRAKGRLSLPIELYSPEECEAAANDIAQDGHTDVTSTLEVR